MRRTLTLSADQLATLTTLARTAAKPYLRERAGALIKIAGGRSAHSVATDGLALPRDPDTVYDWLDRFQAEGVAGLTIRPGRGRRPAFSP